MCLLCHDFDFAVENRFPIANYKIIPGLENPNGDGVRPDFDLESISKSKKNLSEGDWLLIWVLIQCCILLRHLLKPNAAMTTSTST